MCVIYFLEPFMYCQQTIPQPYQILKIVIHQILDLLLIVYTLTRSNIRSLVIPLCPMLAETFFDLLSSPHTDIPRFVICCYWSLYQYKKHYNHLVLLAYNQNTIDRAVWNTKT